MRNNDFKLKCKEYSEIIDNKLKEYLCDENIPELLRKSMSYSIESGGKRLRPCIVLAACDLAGGDLNQAFPIACGLEMIHTYSLIHDDLPAMDNDDYRRGRLSNHKVFGEAQAILAGDGLLSYAFEIMTDGALKFNSEGYLKAMHEVALGAGARGMVAGQALDIVSEGDKNADYELLKNIHRCKTGAMLKASVMSGAYLGNLNREELDSLMNYSLDMGILFQITDDILDVVGTGKSMGKTLGKDAECGKLTYPRLFGIEKSKEIAVLTAERAKSHLNIWGSKAWFLSDLIDFIVERNY